MSDKQVSSGGNVRMVRLEYQFKSDPVPERKFELIVTTRSAAKNTRIPFAEQPTIDELAIMVARTMTNWKNVMQAIIFNQSLPDNKLAAIRAIRNDEANEPNLWGIPESDFDPYVTVWNMVNYYNPGLTITIHSYDDGSEALAIARAHIAGITLFETHCEKLGFIVLNKTIAQGESPTQQTTPPQQNQQRIGQHAESLPDTNVIHAENAFIRSTKAGQFDTTISLEDGQTATPNWDKQAQIPDKPYHATALQYKHGVRVIYPITGLLSVGTWQDGTRYVNIPTQGASIRISHRERSANQEFPTEWENLCNKLALADERLQSGVKIKLDADYVVMKCDSEDKDGKPRMDNKTPPNPVQWKNFKGFYRAVGKPQVATDNAPTWDDFDDRPYDEPNEYTRQDGIPF